LQSCHAFVHQLASGLVTNSCLVTNLCLVAAHQRVTCESGCWSSAIGDLHLQRTADDIQHPVVVQKTCPKTFLHDIRNFDMTGFTLAAFIPESTTNSLFPSKGDYRYVSDTGYASDTE
jgi:hypothetical protein